MTQNNNHGFRNVAHKTKSPIPRKELVSMNDLQQSTDGFRVSKRRQLPSWHFGVMSVGRCAALLIVLVSLQSTAVAQFPFQQPNNLRQPQSPHEAIRQRGFDYYQKGQYREAIKVATQVLNVEPKDPVSFYLRASAKIELGRQSADRLLIREGIQDARQALAIRGGDDKFSNLYIPYLYGMSCLAILERKPSHADTSIKTAGTIIERPNVDKTDKSSLLYQRAFAREQANLVDSMLFDQTAATPEDLRAFRAEQAERRRDAIADYAQAIKYNPKQMGSHINMAKLLAVSGDVAGATAAYTAAVQEFPRNATIFNERGVFLRQQGQLDEAIADFTQAVAIQSDFAMGYINRGFCLIDKGEDEAAETDFNTAVGLNPRMSLALSLRGTARMSLGKSEPAIADFSRQLELNPKDATAFANRGFARFFAKQFNESARDFQQALQLQPTALHLSVWRCLALERAGKTEEAHAELQALLDSGKGPQGWVATVSRFLLGQTTGEEMLAAAKEVQDERISAAQQCEAQFYIGQRDLMAGNTEAANKHFEAAIATNANYLSAYRGAKYELGQFGGQ